MIYDNSRYKYNMCDIAFEIYYDFRSDSEGLMLICDASRMVCVEFSIWTYLLRNSNETLTSGEQTFPQQWCIGI